MKKKIKKMKDKFSASVDESSMPMMSGMMPNKSKKSRSVSKKKSKK